MLRGFLYARLTDAGSDPAGQMIEPLLADDRVLTERREPHGVADRLEALL